MRWAALAVCGLIALAAGLGLPHLAALADVGAGYVAKQMCSCIWVGGRSFESCRPDMLPEMDRIRAEVIAGQDAVRAWLPLLAERTAHHSEGRGCILEP